MVWGPLYKNNGNQKHRSHHVDHTWLFLSSKPNMKISGNIYPTVVTTKKHNNSDYDGCSHPGNNLTYIDDVLVNSKMVTLISLTSYFKSNPFLRILLRFIFIT
jgi:hypothetical protein